MSLFFLVLIFSSLNGYQIELDSIDPSVFDELAPNGIKYSDIHKPEKIANLTFQHDVDQVLDKINLTYSYLEMTSYYISQHIFWEFDWRFHSPQDLKIQENYYLSMNLNYAYSDLATFMISFPKPPIKNPYPEVVDNCELSAYKCLQYVGEVTLINRGMQNNMKKRSIEKSVIEQDLLNTFEDFWQLFNFRATASYYLCWYTLRRNPLFKNFYKNYCSIIHSKLSLDFKCAQISFCPDPCCGKLYPLMKKNDHFSWKEYFIKCLNSELNPCYKIGNGECNLSETENNNFEDLKLNKLNITCGCPSGYTYSNKNKICIDIDECITSRHNCKIDKNESCLNLPGSFECVCTKGFLLDKYNLTSQNLRCINESIILALN